MKNLRKHLAAGLRDLDRGRSILFDPKVAESIKAKGRRTLARRRGQLFPR